MAELWGPRFGVRPPPRLKKVPTFDYIGPEEERLYQLEDRLVEATRAVARHRREEFEEGFWECAYPEAISALLQRVQRKTVKPAVLHWIRTTLLDHRREPDRELTAELHEILVEYDRRLEATE